MNSGKHQVASYFRRNSIAFLVLLFSLIPLFIAVNRVRLNIQSRQKVRFEQLARSAHLSIENEIRRHGDELLGLKSFAESSSRVTPEEWNSYIRNSAILARFKGFQSVGYAEFVLRENIGEHVSSMRSMSDPEYLFSPVDVKDSFFPLVYQSIAENASGARPTGTDMSTTPQFESAAKHAISLGKAVLSEPFKMTGGKLDQRNVFGVAPVFFQNAPLDTELARKRAVKGVVFAQIDPARIVATLQKQIDPRLSLEISDGHFVSPTNRLFLSEAAGYPETSGNRFNYQVVITCMGRLWTLSFLAPAVFSEEYELFFPYFAFAGGACLSLLLFVLARMETRRRFEAEKLHSEVRKAAETLRNANEKLLRQIEEKEIAEEMFAQEHKYLRTLLENLPDKVYFKDRESRFLRCSLEVVKPMGLSDASAAAGKGDWDFFDLEHSSKTRADETWIMETGQPLVGMIEKEVWKNGDVRWVLSTKMPYRDQEGNILGTFGTSKDITELKKAQEYLANEKELLDVTLRSIGDGVISTDANGKIILLNTVGEELTGWKKEEAMGVHCNAVFQTIDFADHSMRPDPVSLVLLTGAMTKDDESSLLQGKDGRLTHISQCAAPIFDRSKELIGTVVVFRDISVKKKTEEELLKASKLESVGVLAGGIAHEFNNVLTSVMGHLSLARLSPHSTDILLQRIGNAEEAAMRARELTQHLLTFATGGTPIRKPIQLVQVLHNVTQVWSKDPAVTIQLDAKPCLWIVEGDDSQLSHALNNILRNAHEAMPEGGKIKVKAENLRLVSGERPPLPAGQFVCVSIHDNGIGISSEILGKIFDPYFTTKKKGIGIGLSTVFSIVRRHDGHIFVNSVPGLGTTFEVMLPACTLPAKEVTEPIQQPLLTRGRVLVMDDEEPILSVAGLMLDLLGYEAETARNGEETILAYRKAHEMGNPFDAVIMDLTITNGMGGKETIRTLKEMFPQVKCVVSSGYSYDPVMAHYRDYGFVGVMPKPYRVEELSRVILEATSQKTEELSQS
ncbi:MAG: sensor hybrid histidine kinase [Verrucomicrobiales bacterium]|nr:sensor hybrid histidine kinase [Verrucomicrobiales bacterium]